jgi:flagellar protein FliL
MTGNKKADLAIMITSLVASLAVMGVIAFRMFIFQKQLPDPQALQNLLIQERKDIDTGTFPMKKMIVNLQSRKSRLRFLDIKLDLMPFSRRDLDVLARNRHTIQDIIIDTASRMYPHELNKLTGRIILENRIKGQVQDRLGYPIIKNIYFSRFVIQ